MAYKCMIIDDEPLAQEVLESHIGKLSHLQLVKKCTNAFQGISYLHGYEVDILFLDIEMPEMNGIQLLKSLRKQPLTIFTTAYRNYALDGFELGVIDFLLKPISFNRFVISIDKATQFLQMKTTEGSLLKQPKEENESQESIFIKTGTKRVKVLVSTISHLQGLKDYSILVTKEGKFVVKGSIKSMEKGLPPNLFIRVHKSFIVARNRIKMIEKGSIRFDGYQIPIGRSYKKHIQELINRNVC